jgi:hypothetical protein
MSLTTTAIRPPTLEPRIRFGSLQVVFDGHRSVLVATSNGGAVDQLTGCWAGWAAVRTGGRRSTGSAWSRSPVVIR